jgi:hypothetical protein
VTDKLRLIARDRDDIAVVSAALQDAIVRVGDMAYLPKRHRFAAVLNRFVWEDAVAAMDRGKGDTLYKRVRSGIHFDGVLDVKAQNIAQDKKDAVLCLLAVEFDPRDDEAGEISMIFAGGGLIRLTVECVDAVLDDLGPSWTTRNLPHHEVSDAQ